VEGSCLGTPRRFHNEAVSWADRNDRFIAAGIDPLGRRSTEWTRQRDPFHRYGIATESLVSMFSEEL
jgi:hypothetical protein